MLTYKGVVSIRKKAFYLVSMLLILSLITPAQAESPMEKARRVKDQIASMRSDLSEAFEAHEGSVLKLEKLNNNIAKNTAKLSDATFKLKKNQKLLANRISSMYRYGQVSFLDILVSAKSFNEFLVNLDFITRIGKRDAEIIAKVRALRNQIKAAQNSLLADRAQQRKTVALKRQKKDYIESKLAKAKKMLSGLQEEIAALSKPKSLPASGSYQFSPKSGSKYVFPVGQPYSFSNDWGAPRGGGTRSHKGNDILAPMGTPSYAVISGTVSSSYGGNAGLWITLHGDDGNAYWYMHMQRVTASGRVSTGQQIGTVGNTGNASGGPPHVHFELHPGGGGAVNPYFFLISIQ